MVPPLHQKPHCSDVVGDAGGDHGLSAMGMGPLGAHLLAAAAVIAAQRSEKLIEGCKRSAEKTTHQCKVLAGGLLSRLQLKQVLWFSIGRWSHLGVLRLNLRDRNAYCSRRSC